MSDDIVTRLRGQRTNGVLCDEAADEIERLRAENQKFKDEKAYWRLMGREMGGY